MKGVEDKQRLPYRGRFAPSPTGPLHAGSIVAALGSWLDARAHEGQWLVRMEDVDGPRCPAGMDRHILWQLHELGLVPDEPVQWQSQRYGLYEAALESLVAQGAAYPCGCSRQDVDAALAAMGLPRERFSAAVYPGTCREGLRGKPARAWRCSVGRPAACTSRTTDAPLEWGDRRLGPQFQDLAQDVGDFIIRRADGLWAYQLAVVVDDAAQNITHVVRGEDLADNTARQIHLQRMLGVPQPSYLHLPLVRAPDGQKLSKQSGAMAVDVSRPLAVLQEAAQRLGLKVPSDGLLTADGAPSPARLAAWLERATVCWARRWAQDLWR